MILFMASGAVRIIGNNDKDDGAGGAGWIFLAVAVEASEPSGEGAVTDAVIVVGNVDNDQDDGSGGHFVHFGQISNF